MFIRAIDQLNHPFITSVLTGGTIFCLLVALGASGSCALAQEVLAPPSLAQSSTKSANLGVPAKKPTPVNSSSKPTWLDLTPAQQVSLMPLAANWNTLDESHKRKWIALSANYPSLAPAEQEKLHSRMTEWVSLSQQQRAQARLNFAHSKQLTPTQKAATWQAYQALSPEEKQKLAILATPKPVGAAAAIKPVAPQKLAAVPVTRQTPKRLTNIAVSNHAVDKKTLLPHPKSPVAPATAQQN